MVTVARSLSLYVQERPLFSACVIAAGKNALCDTVVQLGLERRKELDVRRTATFVLFGLGWVGGGQYALFNWVYPRLIPRLNSGRFREVATVTLVDNFVHIPCLYLPLFYATREIANNHANSATSLFHNSYQNWTKNFYEDVVVQAGIFVPAQAFNFAVNPPHLRVPFLVAVGMLWVGILSHFRGDHAADSKADNDLH